MIRPTRRGALLFAALLPIPWLVLSYRAALWPFAFAFSILMLAAMAVDTVRCRPLRRIAVDLSAPETAYIGESVEAAVAVKAAGATHSTYQVALDLTGDAQPCLAPNPFPLHSATGRELVRIVPGRRGLMQVEAAWVRWRGPLGLVEQTRRFPIARQTAVLPRLDFSRDAPLALSSPDALLGTKVQWGSGEGSEFESLREYRVGLDPRFIDWKHSARHMKMLAREFRIERNHPIVLAFDTGYLMREPMHGVCASIIRLAPGSAWLTWRSAAATSWAVTASIAACASSCPPLAACLPCAACSTHLPRCLIPAKRLISP